MGGSKSRNSYLESWSLQEDLEVHDPDVNRMTPMGLLSQLVECTFCCVSQNLCSEHVWVEMFTFYKHICHSGLGRNSFKGAVSTGSHILRSRADRVRNIYVFPKRKGRH